MNTKPSAIVVSSQDSEVESFHSQPQDERPLHHSGWCRRRKMPIRSHYLNYNREHGGAERFSLGKGKVAKVLAQRPW
jgi:hypothetical protein